jgi:hypothetical protein
LVEKHTTTVIQSFLCGHGEFQPDSKNYAKQKFKCVFSNPKEEPLNIFVLQWKVMELLDLELIPRKGRKAMALQIVGWFTQLLFLLNTEGDWMGLLLEGAVQLPRIPVVPGRWGLVPRPPVMKNIDESVVSL